LPPGNSPPHNDIRSNACTSEQDPTHKDAHHNSCISEEGIYEDPEIPETSEHNSPHRKNSRYQARVSNYESTHDSPRVSEVEDRNNRDKSVRQIGRKMAVRRHQNVGPPTTLNEVGVGHSRRENVPQRRGLFNEVLESVEGVLQRRLQDRRLDRRLDQL